MVVPLSCQLMEGASGLPYATQTNSTVEPLFTVSLGVVTTIATLEGSVCASWYMTVITSFSLNYNWIEL